MIAAASWEKRRGGLDYLRDLAVLSAQLVKATQPLEVDGEMKAGDPRECLKWVKLLTNVAADLAPYETPKLSAVAVPPPTRTKVMRVTFRAFPDHSQPDETSE